MTYKNDLRRLALSLLCEYGEMKKYVNLSLSSHKTDALTAEERGTLTLLLYTTVEKKLTYDYYISSFASRSTDKIDCVTLNILRLGICQLLDMDAIPDFAAVNETVALARNKGEKAFVNAILRAVQKNRDALPLPDRTKNAARYMSVRYSFSLWIVKKLISEFGEAETERMLAHMNLKQPTDLTVNTVKIDRERFCEKLCRAGYSAYPSELSPVAVRIDGSVDPRILPGYAEGEFFVQDAACSAAVGALDVRCGDRVIDVCAAPGGKSFAAAVYMKNGGEIFSFDLHESKLSLIESGADRLGLSCIRIGQRDATAPCDELFGTADRVICDVSCSGLGVMAKKPDLRYKEQAGVDRLPELQYSILSASAEYLACGGRLLYSTCTLNRSENEDVVAAFLEKNPNFKPVDFKIGEAHSNNGCFTFLPHIQKTDGFFAAVLEKEAEA